MKVYQTNEGDLTEERMYEIWIQPLGVRKAARRLGLPKSTVSDIGRRCRERARASVVEMAVATSQQPWSGCSVPPRAESHSTTEIRSGVTTTPPPATSVTSIRSQDFKGSKIVVIPDAHAHPDYDNKRFNYLGSFLRDEDPDIVVCIGDWADMPSLSSYDKGTRGFEGRRYKKDVEASQDALDRLHAAWGRKADDCLKVMTWGNHEDRINRATNTDPKLEGTISTGELGFEVRGWYTFPFMQTVEIAEICFCHYFASGVLGRPIGGVHIGASLCTKLHKSAVQGHSHIMDHAERTRPCGQKIFGMSVGCYTHPEMIEAWNMGTHHTWWRGVVVLDGLDNEGYYDEIRCITMRRLVKRYG